MITVEGGGAVASRQRWRVGQGVPVRSATHRWLPGGTLLRRSGCVRVQRGEHDDEEDEGEGEKGTHAMLSVGGVCVGGCTCVIQQRLCLSHSTRREERAGFKVRRAEAATGALRLAHVSTPLEAERARSSHGHRNLSHRPRHPLRARPPRRRRPRRPRPTRRPRHPHPHRRSESSRSLHLSRAALTPREQTAKHARALLDPLLAAAPPPPHASSRSACPPFAATRH